MKILCIDCGSAVSGELPDDTKIDGVAYCRNCMNSRESRNINERIKRNKFIENEIGSLRKGRDKLSTGIASFKRKGPIKFAFDENK